jgi:hypothetical protein
VARADEPRGDGEILVAVGLAGPRLGCRDHP